MQAQNQQTPKINTYIMNSAIQFLFELNKMLLQVLSGSALILGLYLIITFFFSRESPIIKPQITYHLGCYDPDYNNNHSLEIAQRLQKIQSRFRQSTKLNMYYSKVMKPQFDKDVRDIAKSFERYLDHHYKSKSTNDYQINYYNSLQVAKLDYQRCRNQKYFNQADCQIAWDQYQRSLKDIDGIKKDISLLIQTKQKYQLGLSGILLNRPTNQDQLLKTYTVKIKQSKLKIDQMDEKLINFRTTRNKYKLQIVGITNDLDQFKKIYHQCVTNQQLIIYCNRMINQVKKFQQMAPKLQKKQLENRIVKKSMIIDGLKSNLNKAKRLNQFTEVRQYQSTLRQQQEQLRLLQFQIQNFQTIEQSRCAMCSEQRILQLKKNITQLENALAQANRNLIEVQYNIGVLEKGLQDQRKKYDQLQQQSEITMNSQFCLEQSCKAEQKNLIRQKQGKINELKKSIIDKQVDYNYLQSSSKSKLAKLKPFLQEFDKIMDCFRKKQYYYELRKQAPTHKQDLQITDAQKAIVRQLNDFQL